jgi:SAM-dependent methyltransferase
MRENKTVWDDVFKDKGHVFREIHPDVAQLAEDLRPSTGKLVLDLGSGTGRHIIYLAQQGFDVYGFDNAAYGIELTQQWLAEEGLSANLHLGDMTAKLPYDDNFFDAIVSIQVIHHARLEIIEALIAEIARILKPQGQLLVTVPAVKNQAKTYEQIAPHTFIPLDGIEKGLPHYYFDEDQLRQSFAQFDVQALQVDDVAHYALHATLKS